MALQFLNAVLLLSAGFIAGSWFTSSETRQAPAGIELNPRPQKNVSAEAHAISRGPASLPSSLPQSSAPVPTVDPPVDLAAYLLRFAIADVHEACVFAHNRFIVQTVSAHARFVDSLENAEEHKSHLSSLGRHLAEDEKFWLGKGEIDFDDGPAQFEVIMDSHAFLPEAKNDDDASCFRAQLRLSFKNGHDFSTTLDACSDALVTKNRTYYLYWESFGDIEIGRKLAVVQIPLPESGGDLEFMRASDQQWAKAQTFRWENVSLDKGLQLIDALSPALAQNRSAPEP